MNEEILGTKPLPRHRRGARFDGFAHAQIESAHIPVLLQEVIHVLDPREGEFFVDGTAGSGGHTAKLIECVGEKGKILAVDWDEENVVALQERFKARRNVIVLHGNYAELPEMLTEHSLPLAHGLLLDLGFSSSQLSSGRGFSFDRDEPLLMTYKRDAEPVKNILKRLKEQELADLLHHYGEERYSARIAKAIKEVVRKKPIETSKQLAAIIASVLPLSYERGRIHPATRTFQALRIYANHELDNLKMILDRLGEVLVKGGRVGIISFQSLEDRLVKNILRELGRESKVKILTKKVLRPSFEEIRENPRSRSAKFRAALVI